MKATKVMQITLKKQEDEYAFKAKNLKVAKQEDEIDFEELKIGYDHGIEFSMLFHEDDDLEISKSLLLEEAKEFLFNLEEEISTVEGIN